MNPELHGQRELGHPALRVDGPVRPVARAVAGRADATFVSVTTGDRPVVVELPEPDRERFGEAGSGDR